MVNPSANCRSMFAVDQACPADDGLTSLVWRIKLWFGGFCPTREPDPPRRKRWRYWTCIRHAPRFARRFLVSGDAISRYATSNSAATQASCLSQQCPRSRFQPLAQRRQRPPTRCRRVQGVRCVLVSGPRGELPFVAAIHHQPTGRPPPDLRRARLLLAHVEHCDRSQIRGSPLPRRRSARHEMRRRRRQPPARCDLSKTTTARPALALRVATRHRRAARESRGPRAHAQGVQRADPVLPRHDPQQAHAGRPRQDHATPTRPRNYPPGSRDLETPQGHQNSIRQTT